tara:strand:- start:963 stop:2183 length:1221 start_codon:yes stop_codon:yes gene_type:complete
MSKVLIISILSIFLNFLSSEVLLLKNGTVYAGEDMNKLEGYDVLIKEGKIVSIDESIEFESDVVINLEGKILTPGFIAPFSHMGLIEIEMIPETRDDSSSLYTAGFSISHSFNPASTLIPYNLNGGITTAISAPQSWRLFKGLGSAFSLSGKPGSIVKKDLALFASLDTGKESKSANILLVQDSLKLARIFDEKSDFEFNNNIPDSIKYSRRDLLSLKRVANKEIPLVISADRASDLIALIEFSKAENIKLVIMGASEGWMVAQELSEADIPVIIEPINNLPSSFDKLGSKLENASILQEKGVKILINSDRYETHNAHLSRQGAGTAVSYGLPWNEAIKALTYNIASTFGLNGKGAIKEGFDADLIIWDSDPLEVTSFPDKIYIEGELMSPETRSKMLRDRYLKIN